MHAYSPILFIHTVTGLKYDLPLPYDIKKPLHNDMQGFSMTS